MEETDKVTQGPEKTEDTEGESADVENDQGESAEDLKNPERILDQFENGFKENMGKVMATLDLTQNNLNQTLEIIGLNNENPSMIKITNHIKSTLEFIPKFRNQVDNMLNTILMDMNKLRETVQAAPDGQKAKIISDALQGCRFPDFSNLYQQGKLQNKQSRAYLCLAGGLIGKEVPAEVQDLGAAEDVQFVDLNKFAGRAAAATPPQAKHVFVQDSRMIN